MDGKDLPKDSPPSEDGETAEALKYIEIPFTEVIHDFEWIDARFLLPDFDIPDVAWHPGSQDWLDLPWYIPDPVIFRPTSTWVPTTLRIAPWILRYAVGLVLPDRLL